MITTPRAAEQGRKVFETENKKKQLLYNNVNVGLPAAAHANLRGQKFLPVQVQFGPAPAKIAQQQLKNSDSQEHYKLPKLGENATASPQPSNKFIQTTARQGHRNTRVIQLSMSPPLTLPKTRSEIFDFLEKFQGEGSYGPKLIKTSPQP